MAAFTHKDAEKKTDAALAEEARRHLAQAPHVQLVAELLVRLRAMSLSWWSAEATRARFPAAERMRWLADRPDLRQRVTSQLTGLAPKAARKKTPDFQAALVDSVVDEGDVTARDFEDAFDPVELATYGDASAFWRAFLERFPWDDEARESQELATWLLEALLSNASGLDGAFARKPLLTALDVRTAIDGAAWHTRVPLEVRVAIDRARLAQERQKPKEPFGAEAELAVATPSVLCANLPLRALAGVWAAAEVALGFGDGAAALRVASTAAAAPLPAPPPAQAAAQATSSSAAAKTAPKSDPHASAPSARDAAPLASFARHVPPSMPPIPGSVAPPPSLAPPPMPAMVRPSQPPRDLGRVEKTSPSADYVPASIRATIPDVDAAPKSAAAPIPPKGPPPLPGGNGPASARAGGSAFPPPPAIVHGKGGGPKSAAGEAFDRALTSSEPVDAESTNPWDTNEEPTNKGTRR
ncbi:MAG TPA: hypothetical protein VGM56_20015 [Byssovorax sp.]